RVSFDLSPDRPLLGSIAVAKGDGGEFKTVASKLDPTLMLRVGERNLALRGGWTIFFDRMQEKPHEAFTAKFTPSRAASSINGNRATLTMGDVVVGPFRGELRWT